MDVEHKFNRSVSQPSVLSHSVQLVPTTSQERCDERDDVCLKKGLVNRQYTMDSDLSDSGDEILEIEDASNGSPGQTLEERESVNGEEINDSLVSRVRRVSIVDGQTNTGMILKEGYLLKQTHTFSRWIKRYCTIENHKMFLKKNEKDKLREEMLLKDATVVENSTQNVNNSFTVMTPHHSIALAADSRKEMEEWMNIVKQAAVIRTENSGLLECSRHLDGQHSWFSCSHPRPTYCNVCSETLHGVAWHGLSCEVCKFKCHRRCVFNVVQNCKWATKSNLEHDQADILPNFSFPHQWLEGNLPAGSKCIVCHKTCGSVKRLQDFRCLWCKGTVHIDCRDTAEPICSLGSLVTSTLPPSAVKPSDEIIYNMWEPYKLSGYNPVLAFVNSKSGENKGVRFVRRLKYWLNPLQVFDLAICGPEIGLQLFQRLDKFRILIFGGDGSIGWVLSTVDSLHLHSKCMIGVVPLGTGNDLARVLGWGSQCGDEARIPNLLGEMESSRYRLLDRWSLHFTKDTEFDVTSLIKPENPHRTYSNASSASGDSKSDSKSDSNTPQTHSQHTLSIGSPSNSILSPSPEPVSNHLSPPVLDSVSVNSSGSSGGYYTALSRSPSMGSSGGKGDDEYLKRESSIETKGIEKENTTRQTETIKESDVSESNIDDNKLSDIKVDPSALTHKHIVVVTPPQESIKDSLKLAESLQTSVTFHLSTILLSGDEEQIISSSQVLCQLVKHFITSLQDQQKQTLTTNEYHEDSLMKKCSILNEKLESLISTLGEESTSFKTPHTKEFIPRKALMSRANSLKKAVETVIGLTEKVVDAQEQTTAEVHAITESSIIDPLQQNFESEQDHIEPPHHKNMLSHDTEPLQLPCDLKEVVCINNYFGLGLDAKITYEFHTRREENPSQFKNRTRSKLIYGYLGGREFFTNTQRYLERKIILECDGKPIQLPQRLQGLVFLNIPSYMAGTNFWGTEREKEGFNAPSLDDNLIEVAGITGFTHLATTKVLGIQNHRLAQCRYAKVILKSEMPMQVDGEAWMQEAGVLMVTHKNKAKMIVKDKAFSQTFESWSMKSRHEIDGGCLPPITTLLQEVLTHEEMTSYLEVSQSVKPLIECIQMESEVNIDVLRGLNPHVTTAIMCLDRVFPSQRISETADLEHLQDFESSIKSLIQEILWFLDMEKISPEREDEIKSLVNIVEAKVKKVILAQHSTATIAYRGQRHSLDSSITTKNIRLPLNSPNLSSHRERANQLVANDVIAISIEAVQTIGENIMSWDTDKVCDWLNQVGLADCVDCFRNHKISGSELLEIQQENLHDLGIIKIGHQTRLRQALRGLKSSITSVSGVERSATS